MATTPPPPEKGPARAYTLENLVPYRRQISYGLFGGAGVVAVILIIRLVRVGLRAEFGVLGWLVGLLLVFLIPAVVSSVAREGERLSEAERLRILFVTVGGLAGLLTAAFGFVLALTRYREAYVGGLAKLRETPSAVVWPGAAVFGGLALLFLTLQLARPVQRSSAPLRRMLYLCNSVVATFFLVGILALVNLLLPSLFPSSFGRTYDWTASGLYSLSQGTRNFLAELNQPLKVYVLMSQNDLRTRDVQLLLENFRGLSGQVTWELLPPDSYPDKFRELREKYPDKAARDGLLVLYGKEPRIQSEFIPARDLAENRPTAAGEQPSYAFTGENALMKALRVLSEDKGRPVVYFTQGEEELSLGETGRRPDVSLGALKQRLTENNYDVKELRFGPRVKGVPSDASAVVIAGPRMPFQPEAVQALRDYLKGTGGKKGKLMVLLGVVKQGGRMLHTGLENLLGEYDVRVGDGRILSLRSESGTRIMAVANPASTNKVADAFASRGEFVLFPLNDARTAQPAPANPNAPGRYKVDELLLVSRNQLIWEEKDLNKIPSALVEQLRKIENVDRAEETISAKNLCVAVAVSESTSNIPDIPGHEGLARGKDEPVLVVFGNAGWVSDQGLNAPEGPNNYPLFASCLSWLRGRPDIGKQADAKTRQVYALNVPEDTVSRVEYMPLGLMLLGVVGLGCGVWVVRRR
jgi:hypothetical protein